MSAVHKKASPGWAGFTIGGMVFLIHLVAVPLTGASVNPARTFGPALISGFCLDELHLCQQGRKRSIVFFNTKRF
jgi:aquaporin-4